MVPLRELDQVFGLTRQGIEKAVHDQFREYRSTLQHDRRYLLEQFEIIDVARKVVGVGSSAPGRSSPCCKAATSDTYLGWTKGLQAGRYLYWRQLRDMKGSALVETMSAFALSITDFAQRYADQNDKDFDALVGAIHAGRVPAVDGV